MYIDRIVLENFRAYKGVNTLDLSITDHKNVTIISGNNGYGKSSLLTSLVWCLYGKLMGDVDEIYRKEIYDSGGYKRYCSKVLNRLCRDEWKETNEITDLNNNSKEIRQSLQTNKLSSFEVRIRFKKIFIPVVPCNFLELVRRYDTKDDTETLSILIDGNENELTSQVGPEIFINDFILRKEIAKFFFFDAEKIVELAEISSLEDKRNLSRAYGEVLGIKKYLDLKDNLSNLRIRLRKRSSATTDRERFEKLTKQHEQNERLIQHHKEGLEKKSSDLGLNRASSDKYQERLIREGSSITLEELKDFRQMREHLQEDNNKLKNRMKEMMELAPLAIAATKIEEVRTQLEAEQALQDKKTSDDVLKRKTTALKRAIKASPIKLNEAKEKELFNIIETTLLPQGSIEMKTLLDFSPEQENKFFAVYDNLHNSFSKSFKSLASELKKQQTSLAIIHRKLADAESKENDPVIKAIRNSKNEIDAEVKKLELECINIKAEIIALENEQRNLGLQLSELKKKINVDDRDREKDETAARLIKELDAFIYKLKLRKKQSLEDKILHELYVLMHKQNLIQKVDVIIEGDLIDIELYDKKGLPVDKNTLSKGEQQLYATALLKALVEESHIRFPVFIDSPLQKFDKAHAKNIIQDFYPNVSAQVILFPLLEKELNEAEFQLLYPRIAGCYLIKHEAQYHSGFQAVKPDQLFASHQNQYQDVYRY